MLPNFGIGKIFAYVGASLLTLFAIIRGVVLASIRLRREHGEFLYRLICSDGKRFEINSEWYKDEIPMEARLICLVHGIPMIFNIQERMMRAGMAGTDSICNILLLRWQKKKLVNLVKQCDKTIGNRIPVFILQPWHAERIGMIKTENEFIPYVSNDIYGPIDTEIRRLKSGEIDKTGAIFFGKHGNGKTVLARHFAIKYQLPVYLATFGPDMANTDLFRMFSRASGPCIVLMEDFDKYFNKTICGIPNVKFTFDTILNIIDGIYSPGDGICYIMTANDINKIDETLKDRPSRFKFVKHIPDPDDAMRYRILGDIKLAKMTEGLNLDKVLSFKSYIDKNGSDPKKILASINEYSIRTEAEQRAEEERIKKEKMQNPAEPSAVTN